MSVLKKNFGCRQDAIITDCFVVMPDGVTDANGNRRYCKIENAAWDTGATNTVITPRLSHSQPPRAEWRGLQRL